MNKTNSDKQNSKSEKRPLKKPKKITQNYLHNAGLYYLGRFAASKAHFKTVMMRKVKRSLTFHEEPKIEECTKWVDELAEKFESAGLLNDELFASGLIRTYRSKGLSARMIKMKLKSKSLPGPLVEKIMSEQGNPNQIEYLACLKLCKRKKIGPFYLKPINDDEHRAALKQKHLAILARAGFSYQLSRTLLEMNKEQAELSEFEESQILDEYHHHHY